MPEKSVKRARAFIGCCCEVCEQSRLFRAQMADLAHGVIAIQYWNGKCYKTRIAQLYQIRPDDSIGGVERADTPIGRTAAEPFTA